MQPSFSPSVNLVRDAEQTFDYIPTANARRIYDQILNDYKIGIHSFNIIGSYGTGKSAFLVALMRTLNGENAYFGSPNGQFGGRRFEFLSLVGSYASIIDAFAARLDLPAAAFVMDALDAYYQELDENDCCLLILIDEFGKFLEYAAHTNPEKELYFVQQLAEFANDPDKNILFVVTLHQGFSSYAYGLNRTQREEWEKVKGRLKELTFNEPVEQLLELAASHMEEQTVAAPDHLPQMVRVIEASAAFVYRGRLTTQFAQRLLPFDLLAASVITQALQKYGQNERSLFTFLHSTEQYGLNRYDRQQHPYYNLVCVYDYLLHNYYSLLSTVHNPHYVQWGAIRTSIERIEATVEQHMLDAIKMVKVIGLLNIFAPAGARINEYFLTRYAELALGVTTASDVLKDLKARKIISYRGYKDSFVLSEGTDLNIELAVLEAAENVDAIQNVVPYLRKYFDFPLVFAKAVSYKVGTPRFFEFRLSEEPVDATPEEVTDGFINLVFSETLDVAALQTISHESDPATLYGLYRHTDRIRAILFEIEKINHVINRNRDDRVAVRELESLKAHHREELNRYTLSSLYANDGGVTWVWNGQVIEIRDVSAFNMRLSRICEEVYAKTPVFRNELMNRHRLSSAINSARSVFFTALVNQWQEKDLGFPDDKFPPEKTIYLTLLQQIGIHRRIDGEYVLDEPTEPSFMTLWQECEAFLDSAKSTPKYLSQLTETLLTRPYKLKQGFLDFWLPTFLFARREAFALYYEGRFLPEMGRETLELLRKEPHKFQVKTFSVDGIKLEFFNRCRALLQQKTSAQITASSFIETIKPFLVFYNSLPQYAKRTQRLEPETIRLRDAIAKATDPEKAFFEEFPTALGYADLVEGTDVDPMRLSAYVEQLRFSIRELQNCYDALVDRVEAHLLEVLGLPDATFPGYKEDIAARYTSLRTHLLLPQQKTLHMRLMSALEDRSAWLASIVQAVLRRCSWAPIPPSPMSPSAATRIAKAISHINRTFSPSFLFGATSGAKM